MSPAEHAEIYCTMKNSTSRMPETLTVVELVANKSQAFDVWCLRLLDLFHWWTLGQRISLISKLRNSLYTGRSARLVMLRLFVGHSFSMDALNETDLTFCRVKTF